MPCYCNSLCGPTPKWDGRTVKEEIYAIMSDCDISGNSRLGQESAHWAEKIMSISINSGSHQARSRKISNYLAAKCRHFKTMSDQQKEMIQSNPNFISSLTKDEFDRWAKEGQKHCDNVRIIDVH